MAHNKVSMSEGTVQGYTAGLLKKLQLDSPCEVINATSIELSALIIVKNKNDQESPTFLLGNADLSVMFTSSPSLFRWTHQPVINQFYTQSL